MNDSDRMAASIAARSRLRGALLMPARTSLIAVAGLLVIPFGGCVARAAYTVATLPVKAGSKVIDWTTTSQAEADRNAGRKMRHQKEREDRERRARAKQCRRTPDDPACRDDIGSPAGPPAR